jgi:hypothetical protein
MAIIDKEGNILSKFGDMCPDCLAAKEANGGFSPAEIKRFRQVDSDIESLCSGLFCALCDLSPKDNGVLNFQMKVKNGRNSDMVLSFDDEGKIVLK